MDFLAFYAIFLIFLYVSNVKSTTTTTKKPKSKSKNTKTTPAEDAMLMFHQTTLKPPIEILPSTQNLPLNYCSFFNNRAPSPQINLKNCTWYRDNSCCLQSEIESTFSKVKPLIGSSELCQQYLNNLMCYICAPNQYKFYGKERLTVCVQFCDQMYNACAEAILKGSKINEIYSNGEEFCKSRRYNIDDQSRDKCFYYKVEPRIVSKAAIAFSSNSFFNVFLLNFSLFIIF